MGRPIKNKFINPIGGSGEGVLVTSGNASPTFSNQGLGYFNANVTATVSSPTLTGGTTATISTVKRGN